MTIEIGTQVMLIGLAAVAYFGVRTLTEGSTDTAVTHARDLLRFEDALSLDVERMLQDTVLDHPVLTTVANWIYIWGHWPIIIATLVMLHRHARRDYLVLRNAMFVSGAIGLVIFALYPVAPPRHLPDTYVDTVTELSHSYRVLQPPQLVNEYAALPSLHVGWNLLVGIALASASTKKGIRTFAIVSPPLMVFAVIATGNHFMVDAILGSAVALTGLAVAKRRSATPSCRAISRERVLDRPMHNVIGISFRLRPASGADRDVDHVAKSEHEGRSPIVS